MTPDATELAFIDRWQRNFPLEPRPFAAVGRSAGLNESAAIALFGKLIHTGFLTRIGAVVRPHAAGASTLVAMRAPSSRLESVAAMVNAEPLVNHNYEREHPFNLWFVVTGPDRGAVSQAIERIEHSTGLPAIDLPLLAAYHLDLGFPLDGTRRPAPADARRIEFAPSRGDRRVLAAIEDGLPLTARPYREVGDAVDDDEIGVINTIRTLATAGVITRLGCIVRHRALGYTANAMAVWDVPDTMVDAVAARMVGHPRVTLCYRRRRSPPDWPYNLFCMVHAKARAEALAVIDELNAFARSSPSDRAVLFSTRCFKQRGAIFSRPRLASGERLN